MSCITASAYRVGASLEVAGYKAAQGIEAQSWSYHPSLQVSAFAVCPLSSEIFLEVSPQVVWLTESNGYSGIFEVESNTNWIVE